MITRGKWELWLLPLASLMGVEPLSCGFPLIFDPLTLKSSSRDIVNSVWEIEGMLNVGFS
jgi:hypothetical protein